MEFMTIDLHYYLCDDKLSKSSIPFVSREILDGIKYLHDKKIIHRDIKLENILLKLKNSEIDEIKICDFGFSLVFPENTKQMKYTNGAGTMDYLAPEMKMKIEYDEKIDIWSWGICFYALHMIKYPVKNTLEKLLNEDGWNEKSRSVVNYALNIDPRERYSARDLLKLDYYQS